MSVGLRELLNHQEMNQLCTNFWMNSFDRIRGDIRLKELHYKKDIRAYIQKQDEKNCKSFYILEITPKNEIRHYMSLIDQYDKRTNKVTFGRQGLFNGKEFKTWTFDNWTTLNKRLTAGSKWYISTNVLIRSRKSDPIIYVNAQDLLHRVFGLTLDLVSRKQQEKVKLLREDLKTKLDQENIDYRQLNSLVVDMENCDAKYNSKQLHIILDKIILNIIDCWSNRSNLEDEQIQRLINSFKYQNFVAKNPQFVTSGKMDLYNRYVNKRLIKENLTYDQLTLKIAHTVLCITKKVEILGRQNILDALERK